MGGICSKFKRASRCCSANSCRCSSSIFSHAAAFRSARDSDGTDVVFVDGAAFVLRLLEGVDEDVDGVASSFVGLRFGIAPEARRVSGVGVGAGVDIAFDATIGAWTGVGAGSTATGVTTAPACLRTKSSLW